MPEKIIIATMNDLKTGKKISEKQITKTDPFDQLAKTVDDIEKEVQVEDTDALQSLIHGQAINESNEFNLATETIKGVKKDTLAIIKKIKLINRWPHLSQRRNMELTVEGIKVYTIAVKNVNGKQEVIVELGSIVRPFLGILYSANYNENYVLVAKETYSFDGNTYQMYEEYDLPAGVVRYFGSQDDPKAINSKSKRKKASELRTGATDVWNFRNDLGIDFLPLGLSYNNNEGLPTFQYQLGILKAYAVLMDDLIPNWIATRSFYNVNELYLKAQGDPASAFYKQIKAKNRIRTTKTNSNKYISELSLIEGDPKMDTLKAKINLVRETAFRDANVEDVQMGGVKQKNDKENHREQRSPKKLLMAKAILRSFDDTIFWNRVLIIYSKINKTKYTYNTVEIEYDLGFVLSEQQQMEMSATQTIDKKDPKEKKKEDK